MNAEQDRTSLNLPGTGLDSALSALADGELGDAELDALLRCEAEPQVLQQQWLSYQKVAQWFSSLTNKGDKHKLISLLKLMRKIAKSKT